MTKFLTEAPVIEAMEVFHSPEPKPPLGHTIWTGDFMGMAQHDVACPVCFERHAILKRDVTPGRYAQRFDPCGVCEAAGWRIVRVPRWMRWLFKSQL